MHAEGGGACRVLLPVERDGHIERPGRCEVRWRRAHKHGGAESLGLSKHGSGRRVPNGRALQRARAKGAAIVGAAGQVGAEDEHTRASSERTRARTEPEDGRWRIVCEIGTVPRVVLRIERDLENHEGRGVRWHGQSLCSGCDAEGGAEDTNRAVAARRRPRDVARGHDGLGHAAVVPIGVRVMRVGRADRRRRHARGRIAACREGQKRVEGILGASSHHSAQTRIVPR